MDKPRGPAALSDWLWFNCVPGSNYLTRAQPMKRRLQFSLATLLGLVTIAAFPAHWYAAKRRVDTAREALDEARSRLDTGVADADAVYKASVELVRAERKLPFSNGTDACREHLELMEWLEGYWRIAPLIATVGDPEGFRRECNEKADKIHVRVEEAQRWLDDAS